MTNDTEIKEIREQFIKTNLPEEYQKLKDEKKLFEYLEGIEEEYFEYVNRVYNEKITKQEKNNKKSVFFGKAKRLAKEAELKIKAKEEAEQAVLFKKEL